MNAAARSTTALLLVALPVLLLLALLASLLLLPFLPRAAPPLAASYPRHHPRLKVFVADIPAALNDGLLERYWSLRLPDARIAADPDADLRAAAPRSAYPQSPLIMQYSAEFWLFGDLRTPAESRSAASVAERVHRWEDADVVFVPFFATLSAELELGWGRKGAFGKREGNGDYQRQREAVDAVKRTEAWRRSGGRDHVFVLTGYVKN